MFLFTHALRRVSTKTMPIFYFSNPSTPGPTKKDTKVMDLVFKRLTDLKKEYQELEAKLNKGEGKEPQRRQLNKLSKFVNLHERAQGYFQNIRDLEKMIAENPKDKETVEFAKDEIAKTEQQLETLEKESVEELIEPDMYDDYTEISVEMRPGVGGSESSLFVEDLANMYQIFFETQGWQCRIVDSQKDFSVNKGYKYLDMKVIGPGCFKTMKCESGVHKVIRIPQTEAKGRLHSSTISVAVMPFVPFDYVVNDKDIRYEFTRAQGAGGQHVNKTDSACRAIHIPTGLAVFIQQDRQQERNKKRATQLLKQRLFQMQYQKNMEEEARRRKSQIGSGDRSEKIRTYNFPQDRITDHRTGLTLYGIEKMLGGDYLDQFIKEYQDKVYKIKLEELIEKLKK